MKNTVIQFGTDGWRSLIAEDYTFRNVRRLADALGRQLPPRSKIVVGYDHRFLSNRFAETTARVLTAAGHNVIVTPKATTSPALSFSVRHLRARAGVMITASHNPPLYNGFKVKSSKGSSADPEFTRQLESNISDEVPPLPPLPKKEGRSYSPDKDYLTFLKSKLNTSLLRKRPVSIVADGMHGYGGKLFQDLLDQLPLRGTVIRQDHDPLFGGVSPEPIEKYLAPLREAVLKSKAAIGLAVDGDGDRIGVIDEKGQYLPPHHVFPLLLLHLIENKKLRGKAVQTTSLGYISEHIAQKYGIPFEEVPVGFKYVVSVMEKERVVLGGEESGGYGVGLWAPERDGLLSSLLLIELMATRGQPLSKIVEQMQASYGRSNFIREDFPIKHTINSKKDWVASLTAKLPKKLVGKPIKEIRTIDGLKIILEDGSWVLLRPSGTEPLMRTYAEAPQLSQVKAMLAKIQEIAIMKLS
ncbi:MAG TPA: phosphoglucomutase/phosphomannomutase family protein [Elusimicrobiota bacterium]|nr:phosphoglucomutase/phosphomannomutase family protein [Elusimicrobiota bacterium]